LKRAFAEKDFCFLNLGYSLPWGIIFELPYIEVFNLNPFSPNKLKTKVSLGSYPPEIL